MCETQLIRTTQSESKPDLSLRVTVLTYNAVLHTEAQLKLGIWPPDDRHGDWRTVDNAELHILLAF